MAFEKVKKRNGTIVDFDRTHIERAIEKAFVATATAYEADLMGAITDEVLASLEASLGEKTPAVEDIQDVVEKKINDRGFFEVAKAYIIYRREREKARELEKQETLARISRSEIKVVKRDGTITDFDITQIEKAIANSCRGFEKDINVLEIVEAAKVNIYDGISTRGINQGVIMALKARIERDPAYSALAARFLFNDLYKDAIGIDEFEDGFVETHRVRFVENMKRGVKSGRLDPRIGEFDLEKLSHALDLSRDQLFAYMGAQTLYDRYFLKDLDGVLLETPQYFWMRVAMGLSFTETDKEQSAIDFYNTVSRMLYVPSTPTLLHSGTHKPQMSSCYLTTVEDDLHHIFKCIGDNAQLSKWSGGLGNDWSNIRATGAKVNSINVGSQGVVPFLKIVDATTAAINRSGKRRGATCVYLETWHYEIEDFLDLRKNTGDDRRRTHDINTSNWIPDLFMKRVLADGEWTLFSPSETPDLHHLYGKKFEERYAQYERAAREGKIKLFKVLRATDLWRKMITMLYETGHPWMTFKDPSNIRSPQDHVGVVHCSNLCCMTADQRVVTDRGLMTVGELFALGGKNRVVGLDGVYEASEMLLPRPNAPIVEINTKEGYSHKVTPDHKVWVKDRGWVEAQHLKFGDKLLIQQQEGLWGSLHNPQLSYLMGLIAGDGTFGKSNVFIDIWKSDFAVIPSVTSMVHEVLAGNTLLRTTSTNTPEFWFDEKVGKARLASAPLRRILEENSFTPETKTRVPDLVWKGSRETVGEYLRGLYQADACIQSGGEVTTIAFASKELDFIKELQIVWANFGVKTSINKMRDQKAQLLPDGKGGKKSYISEPLYRLLITSIQGCQIAEEVVKLGKLKQSHAAHSYSNNLKKKGYAQKLHATFTHVTELPREDAYCLTVDSKTHAWTVNGLITKNTEITLNTSADETAVCNLGSLSLIRHMNGAQLDYKLLEETIRGAMRMLDNVIDINFYPTKEAEVSNFRHRPVGLGIMGYQDVLYRMGMQFDSEEAVSFSDEVMEFVSYYSIFESSVIAKEKGAYSSYKGSKWDRGLFPVDTVHLLEEERGISTGVSATGRLDWAPVRAHVAKYGMRNSNCLAIAPTATIANISGCLPSIEPIYKNLYVKSNFSGEFTIVNRYLIEELKKVNLWNDATLEKLKYYDGSLQKMHEIPEVIRNTFKEVFEIDAHWIVRHAVARGKWIDQSQSVNIFTSSTSGRFLSDIYIDAWQSGMKTTYYLRSLAASGIEKSTIDINKKYETPAVAATLASAVVAEYVATPALMDNLKMTGGGEAQMASLPVDGAPGAGSAAPSADVYFADGGICEGCQ